MSCIERFVGISRMSRFMTLAASYALFGRGYAALLALSCRCCSSDWVARRFAFCASSASGASPGRLVPCGGAGRALEVLGGVAGGAWLSLFVGFGVCGAGAPLGGGACGLGGGTACGLGAACGLGGREWINRFLHTNGYMSL